MKNKCIKCVSQAGLHKACLSLDRLFYSVLTLGLIVSYLVRERVHTHLMTCAGPNMTLKLH